MILKPLGGLTRLLQTMLRITVGLTALALAASVYDYYTYTHLPPDIDPSTTLLPCDILTALMGLMQAALAILTGITFLRWVHRANKNLRACAGVPMAFTPGWCVGWYFIPIANLFMPYRAMREIWHVSHRDPGAPRALLRWWWACWLVSSFLGRVAFRLAMRAETATDYALSGLSYIVSDAFDLPTALVALALVTRIGAAYDAHIREAPPEQPAPA